MVISESKRTKAKPTKANNNLFKMLTKFKVLLLLMYLSSVRGGYVSYNVGQPRRELIYMSSANDPLCPSGGSPVCATNNYDNFYFENDCRLEAYNHKQLYEGRLELLRIDANHCYKNCEFMYCESKYQPVCGLHVSTNKVKTFSNKCELNREICLSKSEWVPFSEGACGDCTGTCYSNYNPVCAVYNGVKRVFENYCELKRYTSETRTPWHVVDIKECNSYDSYQPQYGLIPYKPTGPSYGSPCLLGNNTVCAELGGLNKTFANPCEVLAANENKDKDSIWIVKQQGNCSDPEDGNSTETTTPSSTEPSTDSSTEESTEPTTEPITEPTTAPDSSSETDPNDTTESNSDTATTPPTEANGGNQTATSTEVPVDNTTSSAAEVLANLRDRLNQMSSASTALQTVASEPIEIGLNEESKEPVIIRIIIDNGPNTDMTISEDGIVSVGTVLSGETITPAAVETTVAPVETTTPTTTTTTTEVPLTSSTTAVITTVAPQSIGGISIDQLVELIQAVVDSKQALAQTANTEAATTTATTEPTSETTNNPTTTGNTTTEAAATTTASHKPIVQVFVNFQQTADDVTSDETPAETSSSTEPTSTTNQPCTSSTSTTEQPCTTTTTTTANPCTTTTTTTENPCTTTTTTTAKPCTTTTTTTTTTEKPKPLVINVVVPVTETSTTTTPAPTTTTYAPTTYAPTTYAPTTYAPTTYAPTTYAPATKKYTTAYATTEKPYESSKKTYDTKPSYESPKATPKVAYKPVSSSYATTAAPPTTATTSTGYPIYKNPAPAYTSKPCNKPHPLENLYANYNPILRSPAYPTPYSYIPSWPYGYNVKAPQYSPAQTYGQYQPQYSPAQTYGQYQPGNISPYGGYPYRGFYGI